MFLQSKYLVFLGSISYALYLIHQNIGYIIINKMYGLGSNSHIAVFIAFLCSVILAAILTYKVEKPMIDVLRTFYKKTT
jgi:peptidoglycan/LPS O-acetylase OafA/YrhL